MSIFSPHPSDFMGKLISRLSDKRKYQLQLCASFIPVRWQQSRHYWKWRHYLRSVEANSAEQTKEWQFERLKRIVRFAYENSEGYRELYDSAGIKPEDIRKLQDIRFLPFVHKELIRDNLESFSVKSGSRIPITTQGSTGTPLRFYVDSRMLSMERAFVHDAWEKIGWRLGLSTAILRSADFGSGEIPYRHNPYKRELKLSPTYLAEDNLNVYIELINRHKPVVMQAFPSALSHLCDLLTVTGKVDAVSFQYILIGSENILERDLMRIRKVFPEARVYGWYGHSEMVIFAPWCVKSRIYHPHPFYGYTEIIGSDNDEVDVGEQGELVGTGWYNHNTPMIRYRTADYAVRGPNVCPECGNIGANIKEVIGRSHDVIVTSKWCLIPMAVINTLHGDIWDGVRQFQFYQEKAGEVTVKYTAPEPLPEDRAKLLLGKLCETLGDDVKVELAKVNKLKTVRSQKHRIMDQKLDFDRRKMTSQPDREASRSTRMNQLAEVENI